MSLYTKLQSFSRTDREVKFLFIRAYFLSGIVKFTLVFLPFRKVLKWQGCVNIESTDHTDEGSLDFRKSLQSAMLLCDKYTFWRTECYTLAITAKILLDRKGMPGTVYIGFNKNENGAYKGHAWLRSYDLFITGGAEQKKYILHSFYS